MIKSLFILFARLPLGLPMLLGTVSPALTLLPVDANPFSSTFFSLSEMLEKKIWKDFDESNALCMIGSGTS